MIGRRTLLLVMCAMLLATPLRAGFLPFGKKKPKPDPAQRVPELLGLVKSSPDESKRSDAADELRKYEPQQFPEMIPTLLDVMQTDQKPGVRMSAMSTLSKYRPVSVEIGLAFEQVLAKDTSMRVRLSARQTLLSYHLAGYRTPKDEKKGTKEPPLAPPVPSNTGANAPAPLPPIETVPPAVSTTTPQRMPVGPPQPASASPPPASAPSWLQKLTPPPFRKTSITGPELGTPN